MPNKVFWTNGAGTSPIHQRQPGTSRKTLCGRTVQRPATWTNDAVSCCDCQRVLAARDGIEVPKIKWFRKLRFHHFQQPVMHVVKCESGFEVTAFCGFSPYKLDTALCQESEEGVAQCPKCLAILGTSTTSQ